MGRYPAPDSTTRHRLAGLDFQVALWRGDAGIAPPLLYLNGIGASTDLGRPLLTRLAPRPVYALDMPGIGGAADPIAPYSIAQMAAHVAALLDQLDLTVVDVAGFSWGGALAQELALAHRARVRRLVLIATSPVLPVPGGGMTAWLDADIMTSGLRLAGASPMGLAAQLWSASGWSATDRLPALAGLPTLVLAGRHDQMVPASCGDWLARLIPGARLHPVDGAHLFAFRKAAAVAPIIQAFLDQPLPHPAAASENRWSPPP